MNGDDRGKWRAAGTLAELGELTAQWLEGRMASQPGYEPNCGPDEETHDLVPVLAGLNRAGWLTYSSQPGWGPGAGDDGATWCQRAGVSGLAEPGLANRVAAAATAAGLTVVRHASAVHRSQGTAVVVTTRNDRTVTQFGRHRSRRSLNDQYAACSDEAFGALCSAVQLTVVDPQWGPSERLWDLLGRVVDAAHLSVPTDQFSAVLAPASTAVEILNYPQLLAELDAIVAEAGAEREDREAAKQRAADDVTRIESMLASLDRLQLDSETLAALQAISETNETKLALATQAADNAEHRHVMAFDAKNAVVRKHGLLREAHVAAGRDAAQKRFYQAG